MKRVNRILYLFLTISATSEPYKLYKQSLYCIQNSFDELSCKILNRIYPDLFNDQKPPEYSGLNQLFYFEVPSEKYIDLSNLDIKRIPLEIASKMRRIKRLNLSGNSNINLNEEWMSNFFNNLKSLELSSCNLKFEDLCIISKMNSLQRLNLSNNARIDLNLLKPILNQLTHLTVYLCNLNISDLQIILDNCNNLKYLNFSCNNLSGLYEKLRSNLKILSLRNCKLSVSDLRKIFEFENLEELDLSNNNFSSFKEEISNDILNSTISQNKLKKVSLNHCKINSPILFKRIFDLPNLEELKIEGNILNYDLTDVINGRSKYSLNAYSCQFISVKNIQLITDFEFLEELQISTNFISDIPKGFSFGKSKYSLKYLEFNAIEINYNYFKAILECCSLEKLDLSYNYFTIFDIEECNFGRLKTSLKELILKYTHIDNNLMKFITECSCLESLDCHGLKIIDLPIDFSFGCSKESLVSINFSYSKLPYHILKNITDCPNLQYLDISNSNLTELPDKFSFGRSKDSLKELFLNNSELSHNSLRAISECKTLEKLELTGDYFSNVPDGFSFGSLENSLKHLQITHSKMNYNCLNAISKCKRLEYLNIKHSRIVDRNIKSENLLKTLKSSVKKLLY